MSDFLVNLARRGAGLGSIVRSRPMEQISGEADAGVEAAAGEPSSRSDAGPPTVAAAIPPVPTRAAVTAPASVIAERSAPVAAQVAAAPTPIVQRVPLAVSELGPAAAAPSLPAPAGRGVDPSPATSSLPSARFEAPPLVVEPVLTPMAGPSQPAPPLKPVGDRRIEARVETDAKTPEPSRATHADAAVSIAPRLVLEREVREETRLERVVEHTTDVVPGLAVVSIEPAPVAAAAQPAPVVATESDRPVHVRIGSIEIDTGGPATAPQAAPPAPVPEAQPGVGFDDFARLRSYAPWEL